AVGLVIQRDQFPDRLFAPPKRTDLLADGANPVYDKEIRSEIFSQGTLMLRVVIQVSMLLAIPIMAFCLFIYSQHAAWYIAYVVIFNILVGPVFSAGTVTSERERQTLDLLLTTTIRPWQILWGKLVAGLRVSSVLTMFLVWPLFLAVVMVPFYWQNLPATGAYFSIILMTCATTAILALFCSVLFQKTSISLMTTYLTLVVLFCAPLAILFFAETFFRGTPAAEWARALQAVSPFGAAFSIPLDLRSISANGTSGMAGRSWGAYGAYLAFTGCLNGLLLLNMIWLFNARWRVSQ
ncbi:MAG: ABC transporter permease subunit, partial [Planctomycetales bacterium]|nr:ABC transporter permease subunit [Planctomycetales bacterium]